MNTQKINTICKIVITLTILFAVIFGSYLGYRAVQNGRYTTVKVYQGIEILWDNWENRQQPTRN
jgi:hypothetical protein